MKILISGYGSTHPRGEAQPFKTMRLEVDLDKNDSISEGVVHYGKRRRVRSFSLNGRTRKVSKDSINNDVTVHFHDLSPQDALKLAKNLTKWALDSDIENVGYKPRKYAILGSKLSRARLSLIDELFCADKMNDEYSQREYLVPIKELMRIVGFIEMRNGSLVLASETSTAYSDEAIQKAKATINIMTALRRFFQAEESAPQGGISLVGPETTNDT